MKQGSLWCINIATESTLQRLYTVQREKTLRRLDKHHDQHNFATRSTVVLPNAAIIYLTTTHPIALRGHMVTSKLMSQAGDLLGSNTGHLDPHNQLIAPNLHSAYRHPMIIDKALLKEHRIAGISHLHATG